ncbi:MAG: thioredoxin reductase [Patescibacteria group bacterium]|nr:MAG: thioredoxin reductase [Patescibacteria group bacterium]
MENVIIIGGGPAGLSAAVYLARAGLSPLVFAGSPPGGQLTLTSEVENFPGHESILGAELIDKIRNQALKFGAKIIDQNIIKVNLSISEKQVFTADKSYTAKALLIATGAKALWLGVPGEERLRGKGVSACATCDGFFFRNKVVAVVGGGDTAMEEALTLTKLAKKVYIIHRRDSFRASKIMQKRVFENGKIEVIWNAVVEEVVGEKKLEKIRLKLIKSNFLVSELASAKGGPVATRSASESEVSLRRSLAQTSTNSENLTFSYMDLKVDGLFVAIGHKPDTDIFKDKIELDEKGYVITTNRIAMENFQFSIFNFQNKKYEEIDQLLKIKNLKLKIPKFDYHFQYQTSVEGVFAAGDCVDFQYRQAATAAGQGVAAALEIEKWLEENKL